MKRPSFVFTSVLICLFSIFFLASCSQKEKVIEKQVIQIQDKVLQEKNEAIYKKSEKEGKETVDYISFKYLPLYTKGEFKVPDNWWHSQDYYNLPLEDFYNAILGAIKKGFTVAIGGDISEPGNSCLSSAKKIQRIEMICGLDGNVAEWAVDVGLRTKRHGKVAG